MPTLSTIKDVFGEALDLPAGERDAFLGAQPDDVRTAVQRLLDAETDAAEADEPQSVGGWIDGGNAPAPGQTFGQYTLVKKLGEGGHGEVWEADQQQPVRRRVAIKLLKTGLDETQLAARFGAERQALACMDHPGVARVYDAGKTDDGPGGAGRLFLVMELAPGKPITKFAAAENLTLRERLRLFERLCRAVQHAHQKGVIHRDIKPANVLVWRDGDDTPMKVIDFGIVKLLRPDDERFDTDTPRTEQTQLIGTPQYMSPEQAAGETVLDVRSDVYALGVLLYELTTGLNPHVAAAKEKSKRAVLIAARDLDPPTPSSLVKLPRELDWICGQALAKEPGERYATANELGDDVRRYLDRLPVEAAPPSWVYRLRRHAARNKPTFIAAAAAVFLLIGGAIATSVQAVRATRAETVALDQRDEAERQRQQAEEQRAIAVAAELDAENKAAEAEAVSQFFQRVMFGARPEYSPDDREVILKMLRAAARGLRSDLLDRPSVRAELADMIAMIHLELQAPEEAETLAEQAFTIRRDMYGPDDPRTLRSMTLVANVVRQKGDLEKADKIFHEVLELAEQRGLAEEHPVIGFSLEGLAVSALTRKAYAEGLPHAERFAEGLEAAGFADGDYAKRERLGIAWQTLAALRIYMAETDEQRAEGLALSRRSVDLVSDLPILQAARVGIMRVHEQNALRAQDFDYYFTAIADRFELIDAEVDLPPASTFDRRFRLLQQYVSAHEQGRLHEGHRPRYLAIAVETHRDVKEIFGEKHPMRAFAALIHYFMLVINESPVEAVRLADRVIAEIGDALPGDPALGDLKNSADNMRGHLEEFNQPVENSGNL
ncbi:MAG: serine/threonine-protein kinase [Planctomycetota bacterium]